MTSRLAFNPDPTLPIIDTDTGLMKDQFRQFVAQIYSRSLYVGTGSPENVVEARQGEEYLDETGAAGAVKYIKQVSDISGDKKKGWVAIG